MAALVLLMMFLAVSSTAGFVAEFRNILRGRKSPFAWDIGGYAVCAAYAAWWIGGYYGLW